MGLVSVSEGGNQCFDLVGTRHDLLESQNTVLLNNAGEDRENFPDISRLCTAARLRAFAGSPDQASSGNGIPGVEDGCDVGGPASTRTGTAVPRYGGIGP